MPEQGVNPDDHPDEPPKLDENDPGEVPTSFATKGVGWSGRESRRRATRKLIAVAAPHGQA